MFVDFLFCGSLWFGFFWDFFIWLGIDLWKFDRNFVQLNQKSNFHFSLKSAWNGESFFFNHVLLFFMQRYFFNGKLLFPKTFSKTLAWENPPIHSSLGEIFQSHSPEFNFFFDPHTPTLPANRAQNLSSLWMYF